MHCGEGKGRQLTTLPVAAVVVVGRLLTWAYCHDLMLQSCVNREKKKEEEREK